MRALTVLATMMLLVAVTYGQSVTDCYNGFGIYLEPSPAAPTSYTEFMGPAPGTTVYLVLLNPYNVTLGQPITMVGGYEFKLVAPSHLWIIPTLHGDAVNQDEAPNFYVGIGTGGGTGLPVTGGQALLMTLHILASPAEPAFVYIHPPDLGVPTSIPPTVLVWDWNDNWSLSEGTPTTYDHDAPVFCMFAPCDTAPGGFPTGGIGGVWGDCWVVPAARRSWGDIKAMYR